MTLQPLERTTIGTGLAFSIPKGYYGQIYIRSSLGAAGLLALGGVIDSGYKGEIKMIITNLDKLIPKKIFKGDRIAQIIFLPIWMGKLEEGLVEDINSTRGTKGFGSTGINTLMEQRKKQVITNDQENYEGDKHSYRIGETCTEEQKQEIKELFEEFEDVLAVDFSQIVQNDKMRFYHDIDTGNEKPIKKRPYRTPVQYRQWMKEEIDRMLKAGIIEESQSPWGIPVTIVPKKSPDGKLIPRFCVDARPINAITKRDAFPLPRIDDILTLMESKPRWFSTLDLFSGYNQIKMTPRAKERCSIVTEFGQFSYNRMTFGLADAQATFQRAIMQALEPLIGKCVYVYVDDICIYTRTFEGHMRALRQVNKLLRENGFFLKAKKCMIAAHEAEVLGHKISAEGIHTTPKITKAVREFPKPKNRTELRSFLGLVGYYRTFIPGFSKIAKPLNDLLRKDTHFCWKDEQKEAFDILKEKLVSAPILRRPDTQEPFILYTDASSFGLGAILSQKQDGKEVVIAYASHGTNPAQRKYGATQLEALAVIWAVKHFRHYLIGRPFTLVTDHQALKWLVKIDNPSGLFARWIARLSEYEIEIVYRPGKKNQNVDALSRMKMNQEEGVKFKTTLEELKNEEEAGHPSTAKAQK